MLNKQNLFSNTTERYRRDAPQTPNPLGTPSSPVSVTTATAPTAPVAESKPKAVEENKGSRLIVGPDIRLKGAEITDCDTLVVEGRVEASMDSRVVQIAERGSLQGTVGIDVAEIRGEFSGELTARKQLIIHATGRVSGTIRYGKLVIEEGGELAGDVASLSTPKGGVPATH